MSTFSPDSPDFGIIVDHINNMDPAFRRKMIAGLLKVAYYHYDEYYGNIDSPRLLWDIVVDDASGAAKD